MSNVLQNIFGMLLLMSMPILIAISIITPDKTNGGYFTDPIRYWTDVTYYCDNFNPSYCKGIKQ